MNSKEIREKFIQFFQNNQHKYLPAASLIQDDPTVLFTTAGMQQFKEYYLTPDRAPSKRAVTVQPTFRTSDIEQVGDDTHLTFFEMLGNFSFGGYFKKEAIELAWDFLTSKEWLDIPPDRISATYFNGQGNLGLTVDSESDKLLLELQERGLKEFNGRSFNDNFWFLGTRKPLKPMIGAPAGPTVEFYVDGIEVWNLVFNEYLWKGDHWLQLKFKGVDTGMGLERLAAVLQNKKSVYETDLYLPIINLVRRFAPKKIKKSERILADHIRGIVFLTSEGLFPSNKEQGYVLRRLIRRIIVHGRLLGIKEKFIKTLAEVTIKTLETAYPILKENQKQILEVVSEEEEKFSKTLDRGLRQFEKLKQISGKTAFYLYDTFGFPLELTEELAKKKKIKINKKEFEQELAKQRQRARESLKVVEGKANPRLHTAVHLLHKALQQVLGPHALQRGQDITGDTLRFDFVHPRKLTESEIKKLEEIVNSKIKEDLPVTTKITTVQQAKKEGAMALFLHKYGEKVTIYQIGDQKRGFFSKELCGGPHVKHTSEIGKFKIISEKSSSSGVRRIKAQVD